MNMVPPPPPIIELFAPLFGFGFVRINEKILTNSINFVNGDLSTSYSMIISLTNCFSPTEIKRNSRQPIVHIDININ